MFFVLCSNSNGSKGRLIFKKKSLSTKCAKYNNILKIIVCFFYILLTQKNEEIQNFCEKVEPFF